MNALLFINGDPPLKIPDVTGYDIIACSDGAFHYLKKYDFPLDQLDFISGDFDSHIGRDEEIYHEKFIYTPDQDKTDFEKSLEILIQKKVKKVDVYGASGKEMDHFLGNLTVAFKFKEILEIHFFDEFSTYFFIPNNFVLSGVKGKMISLYPFPEVEELSTQGLNWELSQDSLSQISRIGTRNFAVQETVSLDYKRGNLLIFVGKKYH